MPVDPPATHRDVDGDLWRITGSDALLWSQPRACWVEARSILSTMPPPQPLNERHHP